MIDIRSFFKQHLLPQPCLLCGATAGDVALCNACHADLPWHDAMRCPSCALPSPGGQICGKCIRHPPPFDGVLAALDYRFPVDALLRRYKYHGHLATAELLGTLLSDRVRASARPHLLIPMPLHKTRLQERGFNQTLEFARVTARHLNLPLDVHACLRVRATPPQAGLSLEQRRKNLRGVFACNRPLTGMHVALLDDVMTSGASLGALAQAVKDAGAERVDCWVVARTLAELPSG